MIQFISDEIMLLPTSIYVMLNAVGCINYLHGILSPYGWYLFKGSKGNLLLLLPIIRKMQIVFVQKTSVTPSMLDMAMGVTEKIAEKIINNLLSWL